MGDSQRPVKAERKRVEHWNKLYPVGTRVIVARNNGTTQETVTRSEAQMLDDTPVIWLKGISGCYLLDRVRPVEIVNE